MYQLSGVCVPPPPTHTHTHTHTHTNSIGRTNSILREYGLFATLFFLSFAAKYLNANGGQTIDAIGLRGLYLSPTEKKQIREFTLSVERKMWKSWTSVPDIPDKVNHSSDEDSGILCETK